MLKAKNKDKTVFGKLLIGKGAKPLFGIGVVGSGYAERVYEDRTAVDVAIINTDFFNSDLSIKGGTYVGISKRTYNMARVFEHEFFGHRVNDRGVKPRGRQDGNTTRPGEAEDVVNVFRREMGLKEVLNYSVPRIFGNLRNYPSAKAKRRAVKRMYNDILYNSKPTTKHYYKR